MFVNTIVSHRYEKAFVEYALFIQFIFVALLDFFRILISPKKWRAGAACCGARAAQASADPFICVRGRHFGDASGRRGRLGMGALALKNVDKIFSFLPVDGGINSAAASVFPQ